MKKPLIGILTFAYGLSLPLFAADTATLTLSGRVVSETCSTDIVNKQPQQRCGKNTYLIASQNSVTNARGVITRTVNLPDDASRKIIISSYD
ncbi:DUF2574 family protein [Klebsiella variicola]|nr:MULTISPECIES: DUF2574 family protein [Klebsiella]MVX80985.1 DUF2574 family protein [Enterobacteriaceae bacterium 8376wD9]MVY26975.1 DUF2574 family protein [Enterobacteriaceae bacterium 8376wD8]ADC60407.1 conserved hypothetical protein [Klebsiella variicola At-22]ANR76498.1 hypothetical protein KR75_27720 [Klebsiella variicola]ELA0882635.1 DUF2574 family protein [Klebsiella variicola]